MAKRVDQNHQEIVRALRDHPGVSLFSIASLGKGIPDVVVGYRGVTILVEIKARTGKLNAQQTLWHFRWHGSPVVILRSVKDADHLVTNIDAHLKHFGVALSQTLTAETP